MGEQDIPGSDVRASDAEREAVVARLNRAVGEGRLTMDEFSERLELAYAARTRGDLDPLLRDLPADTAPATAVPAAAGAADTASAAPASPATTVEGGGHGADTHWSVSPVGFIQHRGRWRVPRHTVAIGVVGGVDVDLSEAELTAPEVMITTVSVIGDVSVRVPPGMRVEVSNFSIIGGRDIHLRGPLAPNAPVLHIRSFSIIGDVSVRESRKRSSPESA